MNHPTDTPETPGRDLEQALRIAGGSQGIADRLFGALLQELPAALQGLRDAARAEDGEALWRCTHRLHGAAAVCAVPALEARLAELEGAARGRDRDEVERRLREVEHEARRLLAGQQGS